METPEIGPGEGFTSGERDWLNSLREDIQTAEALEGENISIDNDDDGQVINADCA